MRTERIEGNSAWSTNYHYKGTYKIWSYRTVVAGWTEAEGWIVTSQRYSTTTSRLQNIVLRIAGAREVPDAEFREMLR